MYTISGIKPSFNYFKVNLYTNLYLTQFILILSLKAPKAIYIYGGYGSGGVWRKKHKLKIPLCRP